MSTLIITDKILNQKKLQNQKKLIESEKVLEDSKILNEKVEALTHENQGLKN